MELLLNFGTLSFASPQTLGLGEKKAILSLAHAFQDMQIYKSLKYYGVEGTEKRFPLDKADKLFKHLSHPDSQPFVILDTEDSNKASWKISFSFRKTSLLLKVLRRTDAGNFQKSIADLIEIFERFQKYFVSKIEFNLLASIILLDEYPYPKPGVPRIWGKFNPDGLVDFIHYHAEQHPDESQVTENLRKSPLPPGVTRTCTDDFCTINWIGSADNKDGIISGLATRAKWYDENAGFPVDTNYNEHGDALFSIVNPSPTEFLTFYSGFNRAGFKATVLEDKRQYDESLFEELKGWLDDGMTPDKKPLSKISLILPSREQAVAIRPVADQYGFDLVLYPGEKGSLWNPFPVEE